MAETGIYAPPPSLSAHYKTKLPISPVITDRQGLAMIIVSDKDDPSKLTFVSSLLATHETLPRAHLLMAVICNKNK